MKKIFLLTVFSLVSLFIYAQKIDVDALIKMRSMDQNHIDSYLKSGNPNWICKGGSNGSCVWSFTSKDSSKSIMVTLNVSPWDDKTKNTVAVITADKTINQLIVSQIKKYGMIKIQSTTQPTYFGETLTEKFVGNKYEITIEKTNILNSNKILTTTQLAIRGSN